MTERCIRHLSPHSASRLLPEELTLASIKPYTGDLQDPGYGRIPPFKTYFIREVSQNELKYNNFIMIGRGDSQFGWTKFDSTIRKGNQFINFGLRKGYVMSYK